jgi:hypothetical protein
MNLSRKRIAIWTGGAVTLLLAGALAAQLPALKRAANDQDTSQVAATSDASPSNVVTVPAGTPIHVRLDQSLDSSSNRSGDTFVAHVSEPVDADGRTVIPKDAPVHGRVIDAERSGRFSHPGRLEVALTEVELNGNWYPIATSDIRQKGGSHKKRNWGLIGGSAAGGTIVGAIAGGGKGALIGGPIGAGAGTAVAFFTGKKDVRLPVEAYVTFTLSEPFTLTPKS